MAPLINIRLFQLKQIFSFVIKSIVPGSFFINNNASNLKFPKLFQAL